MGQNIRIEFFIFHCFIISIGQFLIQMRHINAEEVYQKFPLYACYIINYHLIVNICTRDLGILKGQKSMFLKKISYP